jgi:hypothetical protein
MIPYHALLVGHGGVAESASALANHGGGGYKNRRKVGKELDKSKRWQRVSDGNCKKERERTSGFLEQAASALFRVFAH